MIEARYWRTAGTLASLVAAVRAVGRGSEVLIVHTTNLKRRF
jgi:hypothetical protein